MSIVIKKGQTDVEIDVITVENYIIKIIKETPGVAKLGGSIVDPSAVKRNFQNMLQGNNQSIHGVKIKLDENKLVIMTDIVILDSVNVISISESIQTEIAYLLKNKFSINDTQIASINVNIRGIKIL